MRHRLREIPGAREWVGRELKVRLPDGNVQPCTVVDPPFVDPERLIVRGLDRPIP